MHLLLDVVYPVLYTLGLLLYLPIHGYRVLRGPKRPSSLLERAKLSPVIRDLGRKKTSQRVWIHAVSVGEVRVIAPLVSSLDDSFGDILISTTTETGQRLARQLFGRRAHVFYFPLDWWWLGQRYIRRAQPDVILVAESEFWPGFLNAARRLTTPVVLINGRISDRSFHRYRRMRFLVRSLFEPFCRLCMQTREDKNRAISLGANSSLVTHTGNLKYDYQLPADPAKKRLASGLRTFLKPTKDFRVWVWGSTREGEEALLLPTYLNLLSEFPRLSLLVAPRHPFRARQVEALLEKNGIDPVFRSDFSCKVDQGVARRGRVVILDTIGDLAHLYEIADLVFIGGSLVPWGGHNIIEAASFGKPILFGPFMHNFREISDEFLRSYGALQVENADDLTAKVRELLKDRAARQWLGRNARKVIRDNRGALDRTLRVIHQCASVKPAGTGSTPRQQQAFSEAETPESGC